MRKLLLTGTYGEVFRAPVAAALPADWHIDLWEPGLGEAGLVSKSSDAEVLIPSAEYLYSGWVKSSLAGAHSLRLMQAPFSGMEWLQQDWLPGGCAACNVDVHAGAIAEFVMLGMLEMAIGMRRMDTELRQGRWTYGGSIVIGRKHREVSQRTVGIVGYGRIGRKIASCAKAFGMKIVAVSRNPALKAGDPLAWWRGMDGLDALLACSDYVVMACPLNEQTRGLIDATRISQMKPDGVLINVARGPVVDEEALYTALRDRRIGGALIDVWYEYPTPRHPFGHPSPKFPFHELDNAILTPHCSGWTEELEQRRIQAVLDNLRRYLRGEPLTNVFMKT